MMTVINFNETEDEKRENLVERTVSYYLIHLRVRHRLSGFAYLKYAVTIAYLNPKYYMRYITKRLYPDIAKEFGTTTFRVERSIRHAIECMDCDDETKIEIFGHPYRCTNTEFILGLVEAIKRLEDPEKLRG